MKENIAETYVIKERAPAVEEYRELRRLAGLPDIRAKTAMIGLINSLYSVCAYSEGQIVAHARVIGDGGIFFYIQDFLVNPEHQSIGLEKLIMGSVMDYLREHAPEDAFIGLMATEVSSGFCERYGFRKFSGSQFSIS